MNKQYLSQRFIAIFMIMLLAIFQVVSLTPQNVEAASLENGATISAVDHNGEAVLPLTAVNIKEGQTVYDVLKEITEAKDIPLDAPIDPTYGPFINNIGNVTLPEGQYWTLIINGEPATVGADSYTVKNGDSLLFKVSGYPYEQVDVKVTAVDQKGNNILDKTVSVFKGSSGYDAVKLAGKLANVEVDSSVDSTWFAFINNIGNTELGETDYWGVYLNNISMMEGLSSYIPKSGDHIELRLPKANDEGSGEEEQPDTGTEIPEEEKPNPTPEPTPEPQPEAAPVTKETVNATINHLADKYFTTNGIQDHMAAVAIKIAGNELPKSYIEELKKEIIDRDGVYRNVTDYEKIVLSLTSANVDATSFVGYDLIEKIYNNERMTIQGNNGVAYALIALDSGNYEIPSNAKWTREALVKYLLNEQLESGGWSLAPNSKESIDITAMILTALAPYQDQENVKSAINKAVEWIASEQDNDGGFSDEYNGGDASETTSQVIIGLTAVGVDPTGEQFTKQASSGEASNNLVQHLLTFKQEDGGFAHLLADNESDYMASTQALLALLAYQDYLNEGKSSIYQFSQPDTEVVVPEEDSDNKAETPAPEAPVEDNKPVPETDNEASNTDNSKVNQNEGNSNVEQSQKTEGHQLPNTATPLYNLIVIGVVIAVIGTAVLIYTRRRSQNA